jgi:uncharacterized membrane protein
VVGDDRAANKDSRHCASGVLLAAVALAPFWLVAVLAGAVAVLLYVLFLPEPEQIKAPPIWDSAAATTAQETMQAAAIGSGLVFIALSTAATRFSPTLLRYVVRDRRLVGVFAWDTFAVLYAHIVLTMGSPTIWRVAAATGLLFTAIIVLALAFWRVARLVDPLQLAQMVEEQTRREVAARVANERRALGRALARFGVAIGQRGQAANLQLPVSETSINAFLYVVNILRR